MTKQQHNLKNKNCEMFQLQGFLGVACVICVSNMFHVHNGRGVIIGHLGDFYSAVDYLIKINKNKIL